MLNAVEVDEVSKTFRIHHERHSSLKERLLRPGGGSHSDFEALRAVSFNVGPAETVGILGRNGSGKSTILKTICGVLQPSSGEVRLRGTLAALLELGAGFQPELSGRDNIYLSGSMLGLSKRTIRGLFDEIVEFSELGDFIDTPVKFYSSGMYVRLGFAVAVNVDPDILVVDEVLAVGDEKFQAKCMARISRLQNDGRSILLVSHSAAQVQTLCSRAVVLDHGSVIADGAVGTSVDAFRSVLHADTREVDSASPRARVESVTTESGRFDVVMGGAWRGITRVHSEFAGDVRVVAAIRSPRNELLSATPISQGLVSLRPGVQDLAVQIARLPFLPGTYTLSISLRDADSGDSVAHVEQAAIIEITGESFSDGVFELDFDAKIL